MMSAGDLESVSLLEIDLFQGIATLLASEPAIAAMRVFLILFGFLLIYLGRKGVLEALIRLLDLANAAPLCRVKTAGNAVVAPFRSARRPSDSGA